MWAYTVLEIPCAWNIRWCFNTRKQILKGVRDALGKVLKGLRKIYEMLLKGFRKTLERFLKGSGKVRKMLLQGFEKAFEGLLKGS